MTFEQIFESFEWKPIRNCPGRYVLSAGRHDISPVELIGEEAAVSVYRTAATKDAVFVAAFEEGGLISYGREDGTFLHTLNTKEGFERKLCQLDIPIT